MKSILHMILYETECFIFFNLDFNSSNALAKGRAGKLVSLFKRKLKIDRLKIRNPQ